MILDQQIKVVKKQLDYFSKASETWVKSGKMTELDRNYQIDGLECAINSLIVLRNFERDIIAKNEKLLKEVK